MKKQSKAKKSFAIVCFSLIAVLVIGGASYAAYHLTQPSNNTPNWANIGGGAEGGNDSSDTNIVEEPNVISILILGLDDEASLPDTMLAIYLDLDNHDVSIISIPRDTMVNITPELRAEFAAVGRPNSLPSRNEVKLNEIFTRGGVSTHGLTFVTNHIQGLLDIEFDYFITLDLRAFRFIVDDFGGIYVDVPRRMVYTGRTFVNAYGETVHEAGQINVDLHPGWQRLNGYQAEQFVRFRDGMGDLGRIERQQIFLQALFSQILTMEAILNNPMSLFNSFVSHINTDIGIVSAIRYSESGVARMLSVDNISFYTLPGAAAMIGGVSYFVVDNEATLEMMASIVAPHTDNVADGQEEQEAGI